MREQTAKKPRKKAGTKLKVAKKVPELLSPSELEEQINGKFGDPAKKTLWLYYFLDETSSLTFFNPVESAIAAGFDASSRPVYRQIGESLKLEFDEQLKEYLRKHQLSEISVMGKMTELLHARIKKVFSHNGLITDTIELPDTDTQVKVLKLILDYMQYTDAPNNNKLRIDIKYDSDQSEQELKKMDKKEKAAWVNMEIEKAKGRIKQLESQKVRS